MRNDGGGQARQFGRQAQFVGERGTARCNQGGLRIAQGVHHGIA